MVGVLLGILIPLMYIAIGAVVARVSFVYMVNRANCNCLKHSRRHDTLCKAYDTTFPALMIGFFWPLAFLIPVGLWICSPTKRERRIIQEGKAEKELYELRAKAREFGLDL